MFGIRCQRGVGVWLLAGAAALVSGVPAHGYNVYGLGAEQPNPWSAAVSSEPGDYIAAGPDGLGSRRVAVGTQTSYPTWRETLAVLRGQHRRLVAAPLLPARHPEPGPGRGAGTASSTASSTTSPSAAATTSPPPSSWCGPSSTATRRRPSLFRASATEDPAQRAQFYVQNTIVNLGADFPINRVRFFPRLGRENPKLEEILDGMGAPRLSPEDLGEQDFSLNTLPWYEVSAAPRVPPASPGAASGAAAPVPGSGASPGRTRSPIHSSPSSAGSWRTSTWSSTSASRAGRCSGSPSGRWTPSPTGRWPSSRSSARASCQGRCTPPPSSTSASPWPGAGSAGAGRTTRRPGSPCAPVPAPTPTPTATGYRG